MARVLTVSLAQPAFIR